MSLSYNVLLMNPARIISKYGGIITEQGSQKINFICLRFTGIKVLHIPLESYKKSYHNGNSS